MSIAPLFAIGWNEVLPIVFVLVVVMGWVIRAFSAIVPKQPPPRQPVRPPVNPPNAGKAADPLQSEIDQFLKQAQAMREGKPNPARNQPAGRNPMPSATKPTGSSTAADKSRTTRRPSSAPVAPQREAPRQPARPLVAESKPTPRRDSLTPDSPARPQTGSTFAPASLGKMAQDADVEFREHMDRVFKHDVGNLPPGSEAEVVLTVATDEAPAAKDSGKRKAAREIAVLLSDRKNIRNTIVLNEIISRPEHRW
ncbi:MAG TPA: hypothetical protein VGJ15_05055 [Pirellulales bacterium]|jgi:hypothetical protein